MSENNLEPNTIQNIPINNVKSGIELIFTS